MATILLSAAGAAIGSGFGGTVLGLSGAVIGRAVGATLGRVVDQRILGAGSDAVDVGRVDRFRLMGAGEGTGIARHWGCIRVAGQVIWATRFREDVESSGGGGKGAPKPKSNEYSYSVSLAVALCEGEITRVGRIWADGAEVAADGFAYRVYTGSEAQLPDAKIAAVEGAGQAPAYRGIAYVVIEDLALAPFGNRVPQFTFEVFRAAQGMAAGDALTLSDAVRGVAMLPGTGEYALATTPVHYNDGPGVNRSANVNTPSGKTDFATSLDRLREEAAGCGSVSLIVSWFGSDLRCGSCEVKPKVEQTASDGVGMPWRAGGIVRAGAEVVPRVGGRSVYGGTPADAAVLEAIRAVRAGGQEAMFYPFILMEQLAGNGRPDPWSEATDQPVLPWRGRITLATAPGRAGTTDRAAAAAVEVAAFFGSAQPSHFSVASGAVVYTGPAEWKYRRFIMHYAHLCALAGGVDAFCIGSEMRGLTTIRGAADAFPAVAALCQLAADVRAILGPATKISYAADWTEYFGYHVGSSVHFHLDPLWSHPAIDFVGIDNYMPLSDWRDGVLHADADAGSIYDLGYLKRNVAGGEGYDWYYDSPEGEAAQTRKPITDGAYGEPWVFRYKDLRGWWGNPHHDRIDGLRQPTPTGWVPGSKPIRFTEYGCAAIDKGTNQPNRFLDAKSSESGVPKFSNGRRDDLIQMQYLRAVAEYWGEGANNPVSASYGAPMLDMARAHVWAWDARPFPQFPANTALWGDAENYARGHWLNGRITAQTLAAVVGEICEASGVGAIDTDRLHGLVRGFSQADVGPARAMLQPLMLAYGFEALEREGRLVFRMRDGRSVAVLDEGALAVTADNGGLETVRAAEVEIAGRVRIGYTEAGGTYETRNAEAIFPDEVSYGVSQTDLALVLTAAEATGIAERWLAEARVARDTARFALPRSSMPLGAGDVVSVGGRQYRIDRLEEAESRQMEAVRVEEGIYDPSDGVETQTALRPFAAPVPVFPLFLDLPLLTGAEVPHAPHVAVTATPWPGSVAVWSADEDAGYILNRLLPQPAVIGVTQTPLLAAPVGLWDRGAALRVKVFGGALSSASETAVLNGTNAFAIGDGSSGNWEVMQAVHADLVAPGEYDLSLRLRGQSGSDGLMPAVWPAGSILVALNRAPQQIDLALSARGLARHYRIGTAARSYDDPAVVHLVEAFDGIGLRPYPVAHLSARAGSGGDVEVAWIRRTRIDGDTWASLEVPLGEDAERYRVRVIAADMIKREVTVAAPGWTYPAAERTADGVTGAYRIEVAQVSARFGAGPARALSLTA